MTRFGKTRLRTVVLVTSVLLIFLISGCGGDRKGSSDKPVSVAATKPNTPQADAMSLARQAIAANELEAADSYLQKVLLEEPNNIAALEMASDVALGRGDAATALSLMDSIVSASNSPKKATLNKAAEIASASGRPFESIRYLRTLCEIAPLDPQPKWDLIGLSSIIGMTQEALPQLQFLAQRGETDFESLQVLANPMRVQPDESACKNSLKRCPDDLRAHLGLAQLESADLKWQAVLDRLDPVLEKHPDFAPAFSLYGRALLESGKYDSIPDWQMKSPKSIQDDSRYWVVAGMWAEHNGKSDQAAFAFWRSLQTDKMLDPRALQGLATNLLRLGRKTDAEIVSQQLSAFSAMADALDTHMERGGQSQADAVAVAESLVPMGRLWEAEAWMRLAAELPKNRVGDIGKRYRSIRSQLTVNTPWQLATCDLGKLIDGSELPEVSWKSIDSPSSLVRGPAVSKPGKIRFVNEASTRGLDHICDIAASSSDDGHWIYQTVGGGVAVIDFDLDGWPDVAAARLDGQPLQNDSSPNNLFRNQEGVFFNVGDESEYRDTGFSHGITIGDFNSDGFDDIYDANFGRNRLFRNNGDGTFTDVTDEAGISNQHWSTSTAIADINGDGLADIFETAYCEETTSIQKACREDSGRMMTCSPLNLPPQVDSVLSGTDSGGFEDQSESWMSQDSPGRGLGLILGQLNDQPGLDVFVANDMTANHFWSAARGDDGFRMHDVGVLSGVAVSGLSLSQASMGMAAGDPDGDGDLDFFLTHFMDDHNTYYEQVRPGVWVDRTYPLGLAESSIKLLGFGAEWIDFDNNGSVELIIANGHVDDFRDTNVPYKMPTQVFSLDQLGRWTQQNATELGDYFQSMHVGRAIANLDVDRDGLMDVAVSHLEEPVALLMNQTEGGSKSTGLKFRSTSGHRDAIGTVITASLGDRAITQQLLGGNGYMCSNQRQITIGSGGAKEIENLTVTWPSGAKQSIGTVAVGRDYLIVEGLDGAFELASH